MPSPGSDLLTTEIAHMLNNVNFSLYTSELIMMKASESKLKALLVIDILV